MSKECKKYGPFRRFGGSCEQAWYQEWADVSDGSRCSWGRLRRSDRKGPVKIWS